jgi:hypothetical protein
MRIERRNSRSNAPGEAAELYLRAYCQRHGLDAAVLADDSGLLVAGAGDVDLDSLAALSGCPQRLRDAHADGHVVAISVGGTSMRLAGLGPSPRTGEAAIALTRILA